MAQSKKDNARMEFPLQIARQYPAPLDKSSVFYSKDEAEEYAQSSPISYAGQVIAVVGEEQGTVDIYKIGIDGSLMGLVSENYVDEKIKSAITTALKTPV